MLLFQQIDHKNVALFISFLHKSLKEDEDANNFPVIRSEREPRCEPNPHVVLAQCRIQPCLQRGWQEPKYQIQSSPNKFDCVLAEAVGPSCLPTKEIVKSHVVRECEGRIVDVQKTRDEFVLFVYEVGDLLQTQAE